MKYHNIQIIGTPGTQKISYLFQKLTSQPPTLILQPSFQRRLVWSNEHKEKFIETILLGLPCPEIYIAQSGVDLKTLASQEVVVDGQQRLSTIIEYLGEEDTGTFGKLIPKYRDLDDKAKEMFLGYNIIMRDLGNVTQNQIKEIFSRINSTKYALEAIEINNAIYDGEFINLAREIINEKEIQELPFLSETAISRMEDLNYVLLLLSTIINKGYFTQANEVENFIARFNNEFLKKDELKNAFSKTLDVINKFNLEIDSIWYRKSNYFTLFVELCKVIDRIDSSNSTEILKLLVLLENNIISSKNKSENNVYSEYYNRMYSGTNSRTARVIRGKLVEKTIKEGLNLT